MNTGVVRQWITERYIGTHVIRFFIVVRSKRKLPIHLCHNMGDIRMSAVRPFHTMCAIPTCVIRPDHSLRDLDACALGQCDSVRDVHECEVWPCYTEREMCTSTVNTWKTWVNMHEHLVRPCQTVCVGALDRLQRCGSPMSSCSWHSPMSHAPMAWCL